MMVEAVGTCEMSPYFYESTRCNIPESCHLHTRRRENLKSHSDIVLFLTRNNAHLFRANTPEQQWFQQAKKLLTIQAVAVSLNRFTVETFTLRWFFASLSPQRPGFAPGSVHM
jgi:hypothetical protein